MAQTMRDPAHQAVAVTASDSTVYTPPLRGLWVGGAGNVAVIMQGDTSAVTITGVTAGSLLPLLVKQVMSTNTTATSMVGFR